MSYSPPSIGSAGFVAPSFRRAIELWSNPGDIIFSPFAGIGSEGYVAIEERRRFVGAELKDTYYRQAFANLAAALKLRDQGTLYGCGD